MRKSFNQKIKKLSSSLIVVLLICMNFLIHLPFKAEAATTELKGLGDVSYYNAIIFGDHSATSADIEGAMAVQKNMNASSYTVVAAATGANNLAGATWVDEGYPSLLLGGQFTKAGAGQVIIQDGTVAMTKDGDPDGAMKTSYDRISYKEQAEIDAKFKEFRKDVDGVIGDASKLQTDKPKPNMSFGIGEDVNNPNIYVSSGQTGKKTFDVKDVFLPNVENKDFIVIYSDAEEVSFGGGAILYDTRNTGMATDLINTSQAYDPNSSFTELASKVIWVFPNATKITTKGYGVVGSVFAPNAVVETKGGSINGQAYVGGLHQRDGFEVHNFKFNWPKWNKPVAEKGHLQIKKVDENDKNIVLKDAKFDVIDKDNNVVATVTTNEKGIAEVKDLPLGDYFVKEISAPEGYIKVDTPVKVTIDNTNVIELVMKNKKKVENGQFKLLKKDSESGQLLPGAKFDVIDKDGKVVETIVTDDKGEALSKQLSVGSYTLKEVEAPKGYELSSSSVSVDVEANKVVTVDVVNKKIPEKVTGQFEIVKVDAEDKTKVLSDAEFEVYKDGKKVDTLRTDKTGKVISQKLDPGTYTLKETKAPQGYKLLKEEIEVVVEANKVVEVQIENAKELGSLQVIKKDAESGIVLAGAEFKLKNESGQVVGETKTTDKDGVVKFENVVPGKYTLEETKAPEGYKALEVTVEVNVVANEVVKQEVTNEKVTGQFEIVKVDANDKTKLLSGAEFEVYKDGKKVAELKTDESGKVMSPKLPLGEYTVKETKAPAGYKLSNKEWKVTIQNEKEVVKVEAENEKILGSLQIIKMDDKDQTKRLAGAEFTLKDAKGNVVKEGITTDKSGTVKVDGLVPGEYTLEETKAPEGYELTKQIIHVTVDGEKVIDVKVTNGKSLGQFEIVKVDAEDKTKVLSDAEFEVYKDGKKVDTLRTDKTGKVISQKLEPGTYTLKETKAPQGYKLLKEEIEVVVEANKVVEVQIENAKELGSLQVIKKDAESGIVLAGAEFKLKNESGQVVGETKTTDKDGVVKFENVVPGKYTLEETKAPEGYKALEVTVEVNVVANEVVKQEVTNEKVTGQFEIVKVDAQDKTKVLSDAEFEVYKDGKKVDTLRTDKTGKVISQKLEPGTYTLKETKAPQGYKLLKEEIKVVVEANKVVEVQIENAKELGSLQVIKKDSESGKVLAGAEFKLKNESGQVVGETKTTDKDGVVKFESLVPGKYTLEETKAPEGYKALEVTVEVNVVANEVVKQEVTNEKVTGQFEIVKVDAEDKTKVLSDAEFEVYKDGKKVDTLRTDKTGKVISQKLEPATYTLKETKAPQGYKLLKEEIEVVVEADKVVEVQIENAKELGSLQVIKKDAESGKVLAGAEFRLKNESGQVVGEAKTTNKDGVVKFESLVPGKYTLEETKAPEGYKALEVRVEVNVVANDVVKQEVMNEKVKEEITGQLEITKVDANNTNTTLAGAVFEIWKDGTKIDTLTTNKSGKATSKKLEPGDYTLKEIQAPEGYTLSDKEMKFTISNEKIEVVKLQITNKKDTDKDPEKPGEGTEKPDEGTEKPDEGTGKPDEGTGKPDEGTGKPDEGTGKPGEGTGKPGEGTEKPGEGTEKPGEGTEKPGEGTEKPGEGVEKPNLPEKGQGSSNNQQLPATGHNTNYVPFIGFMLLLLGIRLRSMAKNS
ncbi:SpaA isopeptide-forming pilin-related protein [Bacillus thuringiensis]|uniref:SpaA isopeptide-forming pilin-related protein n=2 Tax=Bacillus TaxID=1386 RepID=UPI003B8A93EF